VTFRFLDEHRDPWPLRLRCDALDVSAAGSYAWRDRPASARPQRHDALRVAIRALQAEFQARYGSPRVPAERAARGHDGGVNTVAKFMRGHDLRAKTARKCRCTTDSNHDLPVADHLLDRQCDPASPNAAWLADRTYIPTGAGWLYLAAVEDLYARRGSAGRGPSTWRAAWWSMPWRWRWSVACRAKGCGRLPTGGAGTPATLLRASRPATAARAAGAAGRTAGTTRRGRACSPRCKRSWYTARTWPRGRRPGRRSSSTSRSSPTRGVGTRRWGTSPRRSTNRRNKA